MELNEAKEVLEENGFLVEAKEIDFGVLDRDLKRFEEKIAEVKQQFTELTEELEEKVFSKLGKNQPDIYVDNDLGHLGIYQIHYQFDNSYISVKNNWNVRISNEEIGTQDFRYWSKEKAVKFIVSNAHQIK